MFCQHILSVLKFVFVDKAHLESMANYKVKRHVFMRGDLMSFVETDDIICAKRLLVGIDEQDKKLFVAHGNYAMLRVAARRGNTAMVEFLVEDGKANVGEGGKYCDNNSRLKAPLLCAARHGEFKLVKILLGLGADINVMSENGKTLVNEACFRAQTKTAEFLIRQGADIQMPDGRGRTCLMNSVPQLKLCQLLIDKGARMNEQDNLGNTALHHAITKGNLKIVQLLLNRGSDQNIKNNLGDDALQLASLRGENMIVMELVARQKPSLLRSIESQQLLGSHLLLLFETKYVEFALFYWRKSITLRKAIPSSDSIEIEPSPVCLIPECLKLKEVNTVEELEELCQDEEMAHMYALEKLLRIVSPSHKETTDGIVSVSKVFVKNGKYRSSFDLLKHAIQRLQAHTQTWTDDYVRLLNLLSKTCHNAVFQSEFEIEFNDVFEILVMLTSMVQIAPNINRRDDSYCMGLILLFIYYVIKQSKSPDQMVSLKKEVVHRLVRSGMTDKFGRTFLHHAVETCWATTVDVLLECGADVNAVDHKNNTALHLCTQSYLNFVIYDERDRIIELLLRYSAHVDFVNDSGDIAAKGLPLNMLDHVDLKCLAATFIRARQIPYIGQIPAHLESFVQMHGRCAK